MKLNENIIDFMHECTDVISSYESDLFLQNTESEFEDLNIKSPLEQILYAALKCIRTINSIQDDDPVEISGKVWLLGLSIEPQKKIGKYRVDFLVTNYWIDHKKQEQKERSVIVECDSQQWHERTEKERRYEKRRDRDLILKGYKIFHYTGKEITKTPFIVAREIIAFTMGVDLEVIDIPGELIWHEAE